MPSLKRSPKPFTALATLLTLSACATAPNDIATATIDGRPVAYRVMGSGAPAIVMISGLGDGMASFDEVAGADPSAADLLSKPDDAPAPRTPEWRVSIG